MIFFASMFIGASAVAFFLENDLAGMILLAIGGIIFYNIWF